MVGHGDREGCVSTILDQAISGIVERVRREDLDKCKVEVLDTHTSRVVIVFVASGSVSDIIGWCTRCGRLVVVCLVGVWRRVDIVAVVGADLCPVNRLAETRVHCGQGDIDVDKRTSRQRATSNRCRAIAIVGPRSIVQDEASRQEVGHIERASIDRALVGNRDREGHISTGFDDSISRSSERVGGVDLLQGKVVLDDGQASEVLIVFVASTVIDDIVSWVTWGARLIVIGLIAIRGRVDIRTVIGADLSHVYEVTQRWVHCGDSDRNVNK